MYVAMLRMPTEFAIGLAGGGHKRRRVTRPARSSTGRNWVSGHVARCLDDFPHRYSGTGPQVIDASIRRLKG